MANQVGHTKSEFDKLIAIRKQRCVNTTMQIREYLKKQFKGMKCVNAVSKREKRIETDREIAQAVVEINQKLFASALMPKDPNLQVDKALGMAE